MSGRRYPLALSRPTRRDLLAVPGAAAILAGTPDVVLGAADPEAVLQAGLLPDHVIGHSEAPVSLIEYASLTCPHCATFHVEILPRLKSSYLDTGKVRYVLRDYPLDVAAFAGAMLARAAAGDGKRIGNQGTVPAEDSARYYALVGALFAQQRSWAMARNVERKMLDVVQPFGFSAERFKESLSDNALYQSIDKERRRGRYEFGVRGAPSFFVNGERKFRGLAGFEELSKILDALL